MFVKDFKSLSPPPLNNSIATLGDGLANFYTINCTSHLLNLNSPLCTLYLLASMLPLHSFSTFIDFAMRSSHVFFRSSTPTFTTPLSSLRQLTPTTSFFTPALSLGILNNSRPSWHESTFSPPLEPPGL